MKNYLQYLYKFHELHNDLPFLPERMKIGKLVANLHDKTKYIIRRKQAIIHALVLK